MFKKNFIESCLLYFRDLKEFNPYIGGFSDNNRISPELDIKFIIYSENPTETQQKVIDALDVTNYRPSINRDSEHIYLASIEFTDIYLTKQLVKIFIINSDPKKRNKNLIMNEKEFLGYI